MYLTSLNMSGRCKNFGFKYYRRSLSLPAAATTVGYRPR
ncbi:hypothetical protein D3OALGB2SA_4540 [Olavius algarvensis associated proteobacterium Delta 3]|nr:hypothetical protein D3OALGB2SA_4540 [Olavius algarvensis associated proteobacterium Delta 3]